MSSILFKKTEQGLTDSSRITTADFPPSEYDASINTMSFKYTISIEFLFLIRTGLSRLKLALENFEIALES